MKRKHRGLPRVRRRQTEHEVMIGLYRENRMNKEKYFFDPVWSLGHSLDVQFMTQECAFYGYTFHGYTTMEEKWLPEDETDGEVVIKAEKVCRKISFNRYIYQHEPKDVDSRFRKEILKPLFDEIAQQRIMRKKMQNLNRQEVMQQLLRKKLDGFQELYHSGSETYFWPVYDLLETVACTLRAVVSVRTHKGIFLGFVVTLKSGLRYEFDPTDFASVEKCVRMLEKLAQLEDSGVEMTAEDDTVATAFASELIDEVGLFPLGEETILLHIDSEEFNRFDGSHYKSQLIATVINDIPIPIPDGYVACKNG